MILSGCGCYTFGKRNAEQPKVQYQVLPQPAVVPMQQPVYATQVQPAYVQPTYAAAPVATTKYPASPKVVHVPTSPREASPSPSVIPVTTGQSPAVSPRRKARFSDRFLKFLPPMKKPKPG